MGLKYFETPEYSNAMLMKGLNDLAQGVQVMAAKNDADRKQTERAQALQGLTDFQIKVSDSLQNQKDSVVPGDLNFRERADQTFRNYEEEFIKSLKPEYQEEFRYRTGQLHIAYIADAEKANGEQLHAYGKSAYDNGITQGLVAIGKDSRATDDQLAKMYELINTLPGYSEVEKEELKNKSDRILRGLQYKDEYMQGKGERPGNGTIVPGSQADVINQSAQQLGVDPIALATVISYETVGSFSTSVRGGKNKAYIGLIQFGPNEQRQYGVYQGQPFAEQMQAVVRYLKDRGFKPGMTIRDLYSTINAGRPGKYQASDRPGYTVDTHVAEMTRENDWRRQKAEALMGGKLVLDGLDSDPRFAAVPYEDRIALRADGDAALTKQMADQAAAEKAQHDADYNTLLFSLDNGSAGQKEIDDHTEQGFWTDYSEKERAQNVLDNRNKDGKTYAEAVAKLGTNEPWDPTSERDKDMQNALFDKTGGLDQLANANQDYVNNTLLPLIKQTHDVPTRAAGALVGMTRSKDPKRAMFALDLLGQIEDLEPKAYNQRINDDVSSDVDLWRAMKDFPAEQGKDAQGELLRKISGGFTAEERNANKTYREDATKVLSDPNRMDHVSFSAILAGMNPYFGANNVLPGISWANKKAEADFNTIFTDEYIKYNGNAAMAKVAATKRWSKFWSVSDLGGVPTFTKYAPQTVGYRAIMGDYNWISDEVRDGLNLPDGQKFQLLGDETTKQEFMRWQQGVALQENKNKALGLQAQSATALGGPAATVVMGLTSFVPTPSMPSYRVVVLNPNGYWDFPRDKDGVAIEKRMSFVPGEDLLALERDKFTMDNDYKIATDYYSSTYDAAAKAEQMAGVPIPDDITQKMEELTSRYEASRDIYNDNEKKYKKAKMERRQGIQPYQYPKDRIFRPRAIGR